VDGIFRRGAFLLPESLPYDFLLQAHTLLTTAEDTPSHDLRPEVSDAITVYSPPTSMKIFDTTVIGAIHHATYPIPGSYSRLSTTTFTSARKSIPVFCAAENAEMID